MVRWCVLEWRLAGECVCVCFSKMKREKMKERKERAGQKRGDVGEIEWMRMMGSGVRWGHTWSTKC